MITDYTTYDDIRSALGVSSEELEDTTLGLETWDHHLMFELEDIHATLPSIYADITDTAVASRTPSEVKLHRATRIFATLAVANALTASLPMFGPKNISDGKALISRFADAPYKAVMEKVAAQYDRAKDRLASAWAELNASTATFTSRSYMGVSTLGTDPVTGS